MKTTNITIKTLFRSLPLILLFLVLRVNVKAQGPTPVPPDCVVFINSWTTAQSSASFNNTFTGCVSWTLQYASVGFSGLTLTVQSANAATATTPSTFGTFAGTVAAGVNPNTSTTGAITVLSNGTVSIPWIRVRLSGLTGTGTVIGILYGYKTGYTGGTGLASNCPGGVSGSVQFNNGVATCGGFGLWEGGNNSFSLKSDASASTGNYVVSLSSDFVNGDPDCGAILVTNCDFNVPPDVATANGTTGPYIGLEAVNGGSTTIATTGVGGSGGEVSLITGTGGTANSANVSSTGGSAGQIFFRSGVGGEAAGAGINVGGDGGQFNVFLGSGGQGALGTSNTGGNGGGVEVDLGSGGTGGTANGIDGTFVVVAGSKANADIFAWKLNGGTTTSKIDKAGRLNNLSTAFAALGTPGNGAQQYCSDCTVTSGIDNTCANSGAGAVAFRVNGAWKCSQ